MQTLKDSEVNDIKESIINHNKLIEANTVKSNENRESISTLRHDIDESGKSLKNMEMQYNKCISEQGNLDRGIKRATVERNALQKKLEENDYAIKINTLIGKQKSFWDVLPERMQHHMNELGGDLEGFGSSVDPVETTNTIRKINDSGEISDRAVFIRSAVGNYNQCIEDLCKSHVDGNDVPITKKQQRISVLDNFLMRQDISRLWNT